MWLALLAGNSGAPLGKRFDPTVLIAAGSDFDPEPLLPAGGHVFDGTGFDGQFFFYLAQDPLALDSNTRARLDNTHYRARRVLLSALAYAASFGGHKDLLPWVIPLINIVVTAAATFALARWLRRRTRSPWLALAYPLSFGVASGFVSDVADPLAAGLLLLGLVAWSENRTAAALIAFSLVGLARETFLLPALVVVAIELARFGRRALIWTLVPGVSLAWLAYVTTIPTAGSRENPVETPSIVPLQGAIEKISLLEERNVPGTATWELVMIVTLVAVSLFLTYQAVREVVAAMRSRAWPARERLVVVVGAAALAMVPFLTVALWRNPLSYSRYGAAAAALLVMCLAMRRRVAGVLLAILVVAGLLNPYVSPLPTTFGPVVTGPDVHDIQ